MMMELLMESIVGPLVNAVLVANLSLTGVGTSLSVQIPNTPKNVASVVNSSNVEVAKTEAQKIQTALSAMPNGVLKTWPKAPFRLVSEAQVGQKNILIFEARTGQHPLLFQRIQFDLFPDEKESNQRKVEMKREVCQQKAAEPTGYLCTAMNHQGDEASQYLKVLLEKEKKEYQAKR
jgi:hypothetical protein